MNIEKREHIRNVWTLITLTKRNIELVEYAIKNNIILKNSYQKEK